MCLIAMQICRKIAAIPRHSRVYCVSLTFARLVLHCISRLHEIPLLHFVRDFDRSVMVYSLQNPGCFYPGKQHNHQRNKSLWLIQLPGSKPLYSAIERLHEHRYWAHWNGLDEHTKNWKFGKSHSRLYIGRSQCLLPAIGTGSLPHGGFK